MRVRVESSSSSSSRAVQQSVPGKKRRIARHLAVGFPVREKSSCCCCSSSDSLTQVGAFLSEGVLIGQSFVESSEKELVFPGCFLAWSHRPRPQ